KDWEKAIASFKKAIQFSPKAPESSYHLGLVYMQQNKYKEAKQGFLQAINLTPAYPEAHYNLGIILLNQNDLNGALASFRKATEYNPNYANAYYGAGIVFLRQGKYEEGKQVLQYAKELYLKQGNNTWAKKAEELIKH
ncbi:MAG TPA: tetratricopeptide repeat protein, partial [Allocoleopsis sp.]